MQKTKKRKTVEYGRYGVYFIIPFFLVFAIWQLYPLFYTIYLGFCENYTDSMFNTEVGPTFIGLKNIMSEPEIEEKTKVFLESLEAQ